MLLKLWENKMSKIRKITSSINFGVFSVFLPGVVYYCNGALTLMSVNFTRKIRRK